MRKHWRACVGWAALATSVAFFVAINYCAVEAFAAHPQEHETSHHQDAPSQHDKDVPTPHHDDEASVCCQTIQAVLVPKLDVQVVSITTLLPYPLTLEPFDSASRPVLVRVASGLSPPARAPTPTTPFYRTTFASHAPPARPA